MAKVNQTPVVVRLSGGGASLCGFNNIIFRIYNLFNLILFLGMRLIINLCPTHDAKSKLLNLKHSFILKTYNYFDAENYQKYKKTDFETYKLNNKKVTVVEDIYVTVFDNFSFIHDEKNNILIESVPCKVTSELLLGRRLKKIKNPVVIDEAVNLSGLALYNYWHFTFMALDKILELEDRGFTGKYLVCNYEYLRELLHLFGIQPDKIIYVNQGDVYKVKNLHVIDGYAKYDVKTIIKIRDRITERINKADLISYPKKLYVRRIGPYSRKVKNEEDVINLLKKYGYVMINPDELTVEEQIKYFMAADIVITPHGANSTNALYMHEGSRFIELFGREYIVPHMLQIIQNNKMSYQMLVERNYWERTGETDYDIDLLLLEDSIYNL